MSTQNELLCIKRNEKINYLTFDWRVPTAVQLRIRLNRCQLLSIILSQSPGICGARASSPLQGAPTGLDAIRRELGSCPQPPLSRPGLFPLPLLIAAKSPVTTIYLCRDALCPVQYYDSGLHHTPRHSGAFGNNPVYRAWYATAGWQRGEPGQWNASYVQWTSFPEIKALHFLCLTDSDTAERK